MKHLALWSVLLVGLLLTGCGRSAAPAVKIGLNAEITGELSAVGTSSRNAAELLVAEVNAAGGLVVAGKTYPIELIVGDNGGRADQAASTAQRLASQNNVLAMVGPNASACAIPASAIAESLGVTMISPWSTNPKTTVDAVTGAPKAYVFRGCFTDLFQARVLAKFTLDNLKARRVAVLYDVASEAPNGQATLFRRTFEEAGGVVAAFETYTTGDRDFAAQLTKIRAAQPDVIFLPAYYNDVPLITRQARRLGISAPFVGSDTWSTPEIIKLGGEDVEGAYFCNHYSTAIATPEAQKFVADYTAKYGQAPDDVAALTYDSLGLLLKAIQASGRVDDRRAVRDALAAIPAYDGVTGTMRFPVSGGGDPEKSAVILQIRDGKFEWVANAAP
ncbi:MAG: ABC transporter substrate-binding protein [Opitutaceae bacterium]|nr:ABC transporter substrate-binding protein [Opitutaceae bacterium]